MKHLVLILSILLSFLSGGKDACVRSVPVPAGHPETAVCQTTPERTTDGRMMNKEFCLSPVQGGGITGAGSHSSSVRNTNPGRRLPQSTRSASRIVKAGKIIENNHLHPFLTPFFRKLSGTDMPERYLYSICQLRL